MRSEDRALLRKDAICTLLISSHSGGSSDQSSSLSPIKLLTVVGKQPSQVIRQLGADSDLYKKFKVKIQIQIQIQTVGTTLWAAVQSMRSRWFEERL